MLSLLDNIFLGGVLMKYLLILLAVAGSVFINGSYAEQKEMVYRYWDWDITPERARYQLDALNLALQKTEKDWGPYQIIRQVEKFSSLRAQRTLLEGEVFNIHASPLQPVPETHPMYHRITIKKPLMKSLLGYRQLIIRRSDYEKFKAITSEDELKALVVGQGSDWVDLQIFRHNGYAATDSEYYNLFSMLLAKRYDYLSVGVIETKGALAQFANPDDVMVLPGLIIYYPLPTFFHVSPVYPELAARVEQGLAIATADGSLDALFKQHFAQYIQQMRADNPRVFVLENPTISAEPELNKLSLLTPKK